MDCTFYMHLVRGTTMYFIELQYFSKTHFIELGIIYIVHAVFIELGIVHAARFTVVSRHPNVSWHPSVRNPPASVPDYTI